MTDTTFKKNQPLSKELRERGLVYQHSTETIEEIFDQKKRVCYLGVDPTAESIHVGNLVTYILAEHLYRSGHKVILLVGGATGLIGDPSGKDNERQLSSEAEVAKRARSIANQISAISGLSKMVIVNNIDWFKDFKVIPFLRDVGKYFSVNSMIKRDSVVKRFEGETGISYTEFSYALLQSYDFYHLHENYQCDLQIGGSDQWGNIVSGIDFIRRTTGDTVYGVTIPLIVDKETGRKFGKSEGNAIWLDKNRTSYYEFYQFWMRTDDSSVIDYLKLFTFIPLHEINEIENEVKTNPQERSAQKRLAKEVTFFVHGSKVADELQAVSELIYGNQSLEQMSKKELSLINTYVPIVSVNSADELIDILVNSSLAASKREAREFVRNGSIRMNGQKITSEAKIGALCEKGTLVMLSRGNKQKLILKII